MPLAAQALGAIGLPPGIVGITCHQATWYWSALEAEAQGLVGPKPFLTRMENIVAIPNGPQNAMLALPRSGTWNFAVVGAVLPPLGTALLWLTPPTHSAVVTANGISGYNQNCVFPHVPNLGTYSSGQPGQLAANQQLCYTITENDIVMTAGGVFHL